MINVPIMPCIPLINIKLCTIHDYLKKHEWVKLGDCAAGEWVACKTCGEIVMNAEQLNWNNNAMDPIVVRIESLVGKNDPHMKSIPECMHKLVAEYLYTKGWYKYKNTEKTQELLDFLRFHISPGNGQIRILNSINIL